MKYAKLFILLLGLVVLISFLSVGCQSQYVRSAKLYQQQGNSEKALEQLRLGAEAEPANPAIWFELGKLQAETEDYAGMNESFAKALELDGTLEAQIKEERQVYWSEHHSAGAKLGNENKFDEALNEFETALLIDDTKAETFFGMGWSQSKLGDHAAAVKNLEKSIELDPSDLNSWHQLLYEYATLEQMDKRIETGLRLVEAHPNDIVGLEELARSYDVKGEGEKAVEYYERALDLKPEDGNLWFNLGALYGSQKKFDDAVRCFNKTLELIPEDEDALYNLALVYNRNKQFDEALTIVEKLITQKPEHPDGYRLKGDVYRSMAEKYEAEGNEEKANEFKAKTAEAFKKAQELSSSGS